MEKNSKWEPVTRLMAEARPLTLGKKNAHLYHDSPRKLLSRLSFYKFAAKMAGKDCRVLDVGCKEGLGTWILAKECGYALGIDSSGIGVAKSNFSDSSVDFAMTDFLEMSARTEYDAVVSLGLINNNDLTRNRYIIAESVACLTKTGIAILGGNVDIEFLHEETLLSFHHVFDFFLNVQGVQLGRTTSSDNIVVGCQPR